MEFFKRFDVVLNALDNRGNSVNSIVVTHTRRYNSIACYDLFHSINSVLAARNHVNRMCLAARVPLIEAGTAGYLGQVQVISR